MNARTSFFLVLALAAAGCGTRQGNGLVTLGIDSFAESAWYSLIRPAYAANATVTFCFKRVRFKKDGASSAADPTTDPDNVDFEVGEIVVSPSGNTLGTFPLAAGDYRRLELDLEDQCASGRSVTVTNAHGSFSTNQRITLRFEGVFTMGLGDRTLELAVREIVDALAGVTDDDDVAAAAQSVNGTF